MARRSNQSVLKAINSEYSLEGLHWSWSSNTLVTWCEQLTQWKIPWCWERLKAEGEEGDRGWDVWMASPMQWTWANSGRWWGTGKLGVLHAIHGVAKCLTRLGNWTRTYYLHFVNCFLTILYMLYSLLPLLLPSFVVWWLITVCFDSFILIFCVSTIGFSQWLSQGLHKISYSYFQLIT